ncbi:MAG: nuclear transport factor 2 family protein [Armatimonadota bacterium]
MRATWISEFIDGLHALESRNEIEPLLACFAGDATIWNITHAEPRRGPQALREFWETYRRQFDRIRSDFDRIVEGERDAALEWHAEGTLPSGSPIAYRGVTILRQGDGGIAEFAGYFDPRPFELHAGAGRPVSPAPRRSPQPAEPDADLADEEEATSTLSYG